MELAIGTLECILACSPSLTGQPEIHKAVAAVSAAGGHLVHIAPAGDADSSVGSASEPLQASPAAELVRNLVRVLPAVIAAALQTPGAEGEFSGAAEVLEG